MPARVLIVDDHPVVLYGLRFMFERETRFLVCGEASDVVSARQQAEALQPSFVVLDLVLGGRDGLDLLREIAKAAPKARILVYSSQNEWRFARRCLAAGARGYLAKSEGLAMVARALDVIARGESFIGEAVQRKLAETFAAGHGTAEISTLDQLSDRELQVLRMLGEGKTSREIAEALELSTKTIGTYCERLKLKLQLASLRDLELFARDHVAERGCP